MTVIRYPLQDGTVLVIERTHDVSDYGNHLTFTTSADEWRREGWIRCCYASANELLASGRATRTRNIATSIIDEIEAFLVERVVSPERRQELMNQAATSFYTNIETSGSFRNQSGF